MRSSREVFEQSFVVIYDTVVDSSRKLLRYVDSVISDFYMCTSSQTTVHIR